MVNEIIKWLIIFFIVIIIGWISSDIVNYFFGRKNRKGVERMKINKELGEEYHIRKFKGCLAYKKVEVIWIGAQSSMDAFTIQELKNELKPVLSRSLGYLVVDNPSYITLGYTTFDTDIIIHHTTIPKGIIIEIKELKQ